MSETTGNNFVCIGASNRLTLKQVKLLQRAIEVASNSKFDYINAERAILSDMNNDLMVIASKMEAGL